MDKLFRIEKIAAIDKPQTAIWAAMHQDYSENFVFDEKDKFPDETRAGELVVKHLLKGNRGHYGPTEGPSITLNAGGFPHSTMQQLRTHRIGLTWDVQSMRYTGKRIVAMVEEYEKRESHSTGFGELRPLIEEVFYARPDGAYSNRQGKKYVYTHLMRNNDLKFALESARRYSDAMLLGVSEEHARSSLYFDYRQNFVFSCNVRSMMHLLDLRWKTDAQLECQWFCDLLFIQFFDWCPQIAEWYHENRAKKARLSP